LAVLLALFAADFAALAALSAIFFAREGFDSVAAFA
jgi:hypothetical protein